MRGAQSREKAEAALLDGLEIKDSVTLRLVMACRLAGGGQLAIFKGVEAQAKYRYRSLRLVLVRYSCVSFLKTRCLTRWG